MKFYIQKTVQDFVIAVFFALVFVSLGATLPSCSASPSYSPEPELASCEIAADCPEAGQLCSFDGLCFDPVDPDLKLGIELVPQSGDKNGGPSLTRIEYGPDEITFNENGRVSLVYEEPIRIGGSFAVTDFYAQGNEPAFQNFEARLSVWRDSRIPGRPKVLYASTIALAMDPEPEPPDGMVNGEYHLYVPPADHYTLKATPQGQYAQVYPPLVVKDRWIDANESHFFTFSPEGDYVWATGKVVDAMGNGIANVQAELNDEAGIYSSTVSEPTDEDGQFTVALQTGVRDYTLTLTPTRDSTAMPVLEFVLEEVGSETSGWIELGDRNGNPFAYPALLSPCAYTYRVVGRTSAGTREPVAGATVKFTTHVGGGTNDDGAITTQATTDEEGMVDVYLIPGENRESRGYEVTVVPPLEAPFAAARLETAVARCGGTGADLELSARTEMSGVVRASNGAPISSLTIEPTPSATRDNSETALSLVTSAGLSPTATTGQAGDFFMLLDPGFYDFILIPPAGSLLPRSRVSDIQVRPDAPTVDLAINVPKPSLLMGRVVEPNGDPVSGFDVKVYLVADDCEPGAGCEIPAFYVGDGETRTDGRFEIIVPQMH